jgi:hypothetical protein
MSPSAERRALRLVAGYTVIGAVVSLAAFLVTLAVDPGRRPVVIRLAAVAVVAIVLGQLLAAARRRLAEASPSVFDRAGPPRPAEPRLDRRFREAVEEMRFATRSHGYWTRVVWPHLSALDRRFPAGAPLVEPSRPWWRQRLRLGPSFAAVRALVARLEQRT